MIIQLKFGLVFLVSFFSTFFLTPLFCKIASYIGAIDVPDGRLKKHKKIIPYLGGLSVYLGFIFSLIFFYSPDIRVYYFLASITMLLAVGLVDDFLSIKPYQKLIGQLVAACLFLKVGLYFKEPSWSLFWYIPAMLFWILSVTNAFNLVDVMDGLATVLSMSAIGAFLIITVLFGQLEIALPLYAMLGALLAFFYFNKPPARIYLGDAGALFIGGFLAGIPFFIDLGSHNFLGYLVPAGILGLVLLEGATLIIIRIIKRIPIYLGSPDHFSIYLQAHGWSKNAILVYSFFANSIASFVSILFLLNTISIWLVVVLAVFFLLIWFLILFRLYR